MSLRLRLVAAIALMLLVALAVGGVLIGWRATNSVQVEMRAAMAGAQDLVREAAARRAGDANPAFVSDLVLGFNGQRHIVATGFDAAGARFVQSRLATSGHAPPAWFRDLIGVRPTSVRIPLGALGQAAVMLSTDPTNELSEVWDDAHDVFATMLLFCAGALLAVFAVVGRSLRWFSAFDSALLRFADGRYDTTLAETGPPEFAALARGFNRMAARVSDFQRRNGELREQLLTLQAEERAEIARDLHDEVGPYLFAINVDAGEIPGLAQNAKADEVAERAGSIREAAGHIQKTVKAILRQLRPSDALAFGLEAAIADLVAFWQRRSPAVRFEVEIAPGPSIERRIEDVAYRIVQESVSNAVRHGQPARIAISITEGPDGLCVQVVDDGAGLGAAPGRSGMGLAGMAERVAALNGRFEIAANADGRGVTTAAVLPLTPVFAREPETVS